MSDFTWSTRREGNSGFVLETHPDGSSIEFGPLPCSSVIRFLQARRQLVAFMMRKKGLDTKSVPNFDFLQQRTPLV